MANAARVVDFQAQGKNVYLKDLKFDAKGHPMCLYLTSNGHEPGPDNDPREWRMSRWTGKKWTHSVITTSDHNYDMGSLILQGKKWYLIAPTTDGPQRYGTGGEIDIWISTNQGKKWRLSTPVSRYSRLNHSYMRAVVNGIAPFQYFWADGNPDEQSKSNLYFGDLEGNTWQLPYTMNADEETPRKLLLNSRAKN